MAKPIVNETHNTTAFLDRGSRFEGTLTFQGSVRIDGFYKGDIVNGNHLVLGEQAEVEGTINVEEVYISGHFKGTVTAVKKICLLASAHVEGSLATPKISIEEGAVFNGSIQMAEKITPARKSDGSYHSDAELMAEGIARTAST